MWESRVRCGISKRGGNGGKVGVGLFHGSHGASFPQPSSGFWAILARMSSLGTLEVQFLIFQNPRQMHIFPDSCGEPDFQRDCFALLIAEYDTEEEAREHINEMWEDLFEEKLLGWSTNENWWPIERTKEMFWEWFAVEFH